MAKERAADYLLSTADVLATTIEDGEVRCNIGDSVESIGLGAEVAPWGIDGFVARPNDPDEEGACQAVYWSDGQNKRIVARRDNRFVSFVGALEPGDRAIVSNSTARLFLKKERDALVLYTESQPDGNQAMLVDLDGSTGTVLLSCAGSWIKLSNDSIQLGAAGGKTIVTIDADGVQIDGASFVCATATGSLGVPLPTPPPAQAILYGAAPGAPSKSWTVAL